MHHLLLLCSSAPPRYIVHREAFCLCSEALQLGLLVLGAAAGCQHPLPPALGSVLKLVMLASCASLFYLQVGWGGGVEGELGSGSFCGQGRVAMWATAKCRCLASASPCMRPRHPPPQPLCPADPPGRVPGAALPQAPGALRARAPAGAGRVARARGQRRRCGRACGVGRCHERRWGGRGAGGLGMGAGRLKHVWGVQCD
jgi:hypothetical protein